MGKQFYFWHKEALSYNDYFHMLLAFILRIDF